MQNKLKLSPLLLSAEPSEELTVDLSNPKKILIIWLDVSFGILISSRSFFLSLKKNYPNAKITLIVNKNTYLKIEQSKLTFKRFFDFIYSSSKKFSTIGIIRNDYEITIIPTLGKFKFSSYLFLWLSKSVKKYGVDKFNNNANPFSFLVKDKISVNFLQTPDIHLSQILFEQLIRIDEFDEPENFVLNYNLLEDKYIREMKRNFGFYPMKKIVVINLFTEKKENRLSSSKFLEVINLLSKNKNIQFCLIDDKQKSNLKIIENKINLEVLFFPNNDLKVLFNLLNFVDLVITCDSEFMHIAGVLNVPQISLFGLTNPFKFAPIGKNKKFIRKSDFIEDIKTEDIFEECKKFIEN